jgi:hypothetical protein
MPPVGPPLRGTSSRRPCCAPRVATPGPEHEGAAGGVPAAQRAGTGGGRSAASHQPGAGAFERRAEPTDLNREGLAATRRPAVIRGPDPSYLLLLVVLTDGTLRYLYATIETVEAAVREKRPEPGRSRRGLPVDVHVLLTERGPLPISRLRLIGHLDAAAVYAGIRPGRRCRIRPAGWPWSG